MVKVPLLKKGTVLFTALYHLTACGAAVLHPNANTKPIFLDLLCLF